MNVSSYLAFKGLPSRSPILGAMRNALLFFMATALLSACDLINPDEDPVSFIRVESLSLAVDNESLEGSPTHNIKDVWVDVDGVLLGAFEMPVSIPVLREGPVEVIAFAGIQENGLSSERIRYPFYDFHRENVTLIPEQELVLNATATYIPDVLNFHVEDFEDVGFQFQRSVTSDTTMTVISDPGLLNITTGNNVGAVYVDEERDHFKFHSTLELDLALINIAYIEIDYKVDGQFRVGLRRSEPSILDFSVAGFNPKLAENGDSEWNKVYIRLNEAIDILGNEDEYEIFIEADWNGDGTGTFLFDNVKVIYPGA